MASVEEIKAVGEAFEFAKANRFNLTLTTAWAGHQVGITLQRDHFANAKGFDGAWQKVKESAEKTETVDASFDADAALALLDQALANQLYVEFTCLLSGKGSTRFRVQIKQERNHKVTSLALGRGDDGVTMLHRALDRALKHKRFIPPSK